MGWKHLPKHGGPLKGNVRDVEGIEHPRPLRRIQAQVILCACRLGVADVAAIQIGQEVKTADYWQHAIVQLSRLDDWIMAFSTREAQVPSGNGWTRTALRMRRLVASGMCVLRVAGLVTRRANAVSSTLFAILGNSTPHLRDEDGMTKERGFFMR